MKKRNLLGMTIGVLLILNTQMVKGQGLSVNTTGSAADASAMLDVASTTQGILVPRMTNAQRNGISLPATGLLLFQTDGTTGFYYNSGTPASPVWTSVGGAPTGAAGGDLTGTYPSPTLNTGATTGANVVTAINASSSTINAANLQSTVTTQGNTFNAANDLLKLNASGVAPTANLGTGTASSSTLLHGNNTWSAVALGSDVSGNLPVANLGSGTSASSTTFWRGDGSWATPTGTPSGTAGGSLAGSYPSPTLSLTGAAAGTWGSGGTQVATITTTTEGRITSASNTTIGNLNATTVFGSGTVPTAREGSGTASSSTYLRGDQTWQPLTSQGLTFSCTAENPSNPTGVFGLNGGIGDQTSYIYDNTTMPVACTLDALYINGTNSGSFGTGTNAVTVTIYKNGSATSSTATITSTTVGVMVSSSDLVHTVTVAAGDVLSIFMSQSNSGIDTHMNITTHFH